MARPTKYTAELGKEICRRIAEGESLRSICRPDKETGEVLISKSAVLEWLISEESKYKPFQDQYARAREIQRHGYEDECIDIADDGSNDWIERETKSGEVITVVDHDHINRSKTRIETRKWIIGRMESKRPAKGGDDAPPQLVQLIVEPEPVQSTSTKARTPKAHRPKRRAA